MKITEITLPCRAVVRKARRERYLYLWDAVTVAVFTITTIGLLYIMFGLFGGIGA